MTAIIANIALGKKILPDNTDCIKDSYPTFFLIESIEEWLMSKYGILGWPLERSYSPLILLLLKHASIEGKYELIKMNEINNKNIDQINKVILDIT